MIISMWTASVYIKCLKGYSLFVLLCVFLAKLRLFAFLKYHIDLKLPTPETISQNILTLLKFILIDSHT